MRCRRCCGGSDCTLSLGAPRRTLSLAEYKYLTNFQFLGVCIVLLQPPFRVLLHAHTNSGHHGLSLTAPRRRYCQLPVSGRRMQQFLQFRLGCHGFPIALGRLAGPGHVDRAKRACLACNSGAISDEKHMIFECTALAPRPLRQQHADLSIQYPALTPCAPFCSAGSSGAFEL